MFRELRQHLCNMTSHRVPLGRGPKRLYDCITDHTDSRSYSESKRSRLDTDLYAHQQSQGLLEVAEVEIEDLMTDVAGRLRDVTCLSQHLHRISSLKKRLFLRVYPQRH